MKEELHVKLRCHWKKKSIYKQAWNFLAWY